MYTHPTWNKTLGPMQKKQSTMRKAKTIGMLLMYLKFHYDYPEGKIAEVGTHKLKNQGREATDS